MPQAYANMCHRKETVRTELDNSYNHEVDCPSGPLRARRHGGLAEDWGNITDEVGGVTRI